MKRIRPKVVAIIAAAGSGSRMGVKQKKQFLPLEGKPILVHTLQRFEQSSEIDEIAVAVPEMSVAETEALVSRFRLRKVSKVVAGGKRRQDSVFNALRRLSLRPSDIVLVHDGVRPFVESKKISQLVKACREHGAAALAVQPKDTIRRSEGGKTFDRTLDRKALWIVQTPQAFNASLLLKAFERARKERFVSTDEAALVERVGTSAHIVEGSYDNIKITTAEDLELASLILNRWKQEAIV